MTVANFPASLLNAQSLIKMAPALRNPKPESGRGSAKSPRVVIEPDVVVVAADAEIDQSGIAGADTGCGGGGSVTSADRSPVDPTAPGPFRLIHPAVPAHDEDRQFSTASIREASVVQGTARNRDIPVAPSSSAEVPHPDVVVCSANGQINHSGSARNRRGR